MWFCPILAVVVVGNIGVGGVGNVGVGGVGGVGGGLSPSVVLWPP